MILAFLWACAGPPLPEEVPVPELDAPTLAHSPPTGPFLEGDPVPLEAYAEDPDGIYEVSVYWRVVGAPRFEKLPMEGSEASWTAELLAQPPGLEVWFKAIDASDLSQVG